MAGPRGRGGPAVRRARRRSPGGLAALPADLGADGLDRWFPRYVLVVEGQARAAVPALREDDGVQVVAAPGSGDDTIAELAATAADAGWWSPPTGNCAAGPRPRGRP